MVLGTGGALLAAGTAGAAGTTLYLSPTGSDSNACTTTTAPCKTLGHALSIAAAGDTIKLATGTYKAATDPSGTSNTVPSTLSGVTLEGVTGKPSTAVVTGKSTTDALVVNASTVTVKDLTFSGSRRSGLLVSPPSTASVPATVTGEMIATNVVTGNDTCTTSAIASHTAAGCKTPTPESDYGEGLHLLSVATSTITKNTVTKNYGGILITDELGPNHNNTISTNDASTNRGDCGITVAGHNTSAVHTSGATTGKPDPTAGGDYTETVVHNTVNNNGAAGLLDAGGPPGAAAYHNVFKDNTADGDGLAGFTLHSHAPLQDMNTNVVETNTFKDDATLVPGDPEGPPSSADMSQSAGIEILGAVVPVTGTAIAHNTVSTEFYGIWLSPDEAHANTVSTNSITVASGGTAIFSEPAPDSGYWVVGGSGTTYNFGTVPSYGSAPGTSHVVGVAATPDAGGYWIVTSNGTVKAFGDARSYGTLPAMHISVSDIVGMASAATGLGYWLVGSDGGVFSFGSAVFRGSMGGTHLNAPVVGMAATPTGHGYWLVATDGGIFSFGAAFHGSMGGMHLNKPVVGIAAGPTGHGYWLVATDGGVFSFGVGFHGSTGAMHLNEPIVGIAAAGTGAGYWLVASDGGIFSFGAAYHGSVPGLHKSVSNVTGIVGIPG